MRTERKFKVSAELKEYVRDVLARNGVSHRFVVDGEQLYCVTTLSGERFHKVVKRAYCEKKTQETGVLHLTYQESQDANLRAGLMKVFGKNSYVIASSARKN